MPTQAPYHGADWRKRQMIEEQMGRESDWDEDFVQQEAEGGFAATEETGTGQSEDGFEDGEIPQDDSEGEGLEDESDGREDEGATIPVRFNHREVNIPISEAVPLIQKGLNYDRVTAERDRLRNYTAPRGEGALKDEFDSFSRSFPEAAANPEGIPEEVWMDFKRGMPLTEAWLRSENQRVGALLERERAAAVSRARTTGSARGRGLGLSFDDFLEGFSGTEV